MRSYGARVDPDGTQHARVSQAHDYDVVTTLWRRRIGNGTLECQLLRAKVPAKRIVQLRAEYVDAGIDTLAIVQVEDELDEARQATRLERAMILASAKPTEGGIVVGAG